MSKLEAGPDEIDHDVGVSWSERENSGMTFFVTNPSDIVVVNKEMIYEKRYSEVLCHYTSWKRTKLSAHRKPCQCL